MERMTRRLSRTDASVVTLMIAAGVAQLVGAVGGDAIDAGLTLFAAACIAGAATSAR